MCISPTAIPRACGSKAGGVVEIFVALEDDVASVTVTSSATQHRATAVVMKTGKYPVKWEFDEDLPSPLKSVKGDNSNAWTITQDFTIPENTEAVIALIQSMIGGRYLVWSKDGAGQIRLGAYINGTTIKGLTFGPVEETSGDGFTAKAGIKMQFKRVSDKAAYHFTGAIPQPV